MTAYVDMPVNEPFEVTAGDLVEWRREDLDDYPATTWTLTYALRSTSSKIDITASASGSYFYVSVAAATSAAWHPGAYQWQAYVTNGSERHVVDSGRLVVNENLAALARFDDRTHARKVLDAIQAVIEKRATLDQQSITIAGRQLDRTPLPDLLALHSRYSNMVAGEVAEERLRNGLPSTGGRVQVRF